MKRWPALLLFLFFSSPLFAQLSGGPVYPNNGPSATGSGVTSTTFYAATSCPGSLSAVNQCVQWVDDDTTDNCGAATTAWFAAINSHTGGNFVQIHVDGSGTGTGFLFKTCTWAVKVNHEFWVRATIDFQESSAPANCIQAGTSGLTGYGTTSGGFGGISWRWHGGSLKGCTNATTAGMESMAWNGYGYLQDVHMNSFGPAGNAAGVCSVSSIKYDIMAEGHISGLQWASGAAGACASANLMDCGSSGSCLPISGQSTLHFSDSTISAGTGANCGAVGHAEGGSHSTLQNVSIFSFGAPVLFEQVSSSATAGGWLVQGGTYDAAGCLGNSSVSADFQFGHNGSGIVQGPATIIGSDELGGATHATNMIALAGNSTDTIQGVNLIGNVSYKTGTTLNTMPATLNCTTLSQPCIQRDNQNIAQQAPSYRVGNVANEGWADGNLIAYDIQTAQAANISSANLLTNTFMGASDTTYNVGCQVELTRAATTSSTLPQCEVTYTDLFSGNSKTIIISPVWSGSGTGCSGSITNTVANACSGYITIWAKTTASITYSTINYASTGTTTMQYQVHAWINSAAN